MFDSKESAAVINRTTQLTPYSKKSLGKISIDQMLTHCNLPYEFVYTIKHPKPNGFKKNLIKILAKKLV